jgi:shikimate dehydrogenase
VTAFCRLAVLGDPLAFTLSPQLHRAGLAAIGRAGASEALRTPLTELGARLAALAGAGYRGANLTHPLKQAALAHVARVSEPARRAASVNTIGFDADGWWGDTTDGPGFLDLLGHLGRNPARERVVLLGAGGAARSLAAALADAGAADLTVCARDPATAAPAWQAIAGVRWAGWNSGPAHAALGNATLIVHATPLRLPEGPVPLERLRAGAAIVDLVYGPEPLPWLTRAAGAGHVTHDGRALLAFQARRSLALWTGREIPLAALLRAVGLEGLG